MQCKEGIFSDILGEKFRRNREKQPFTNTTDEKYQNSSAWMPRIKEDPG